LPTKYLHPAKSQKSGEYEVYDLTVGERKAEGAVVKYLEGDLAGLLNIDFGSVDVWFEEDEQIFQHPKDPYKVSLYQRSLFPYLN
jgi:hypothetical protein